MRWLKRIAAIAALPILTIVAMTVGLFSKGRKCTPEKLAQELGALATGDMSYWDQLECVPLHDPRLEDIRQEAIKVELPLRAADVTMLAALAQRAAALSSDPSR